MVKLRKIRLIKQLYTKFILILLFKPLFLIITIESNRQKIC